MLGKNRNHCERLNCRCTHTEGCEKGYIWTRYSVKDEHIRNGETIVVEKWYEGVLFCPTCDPERAQIQKTSGSSEELSYRLGQRSKYKHAENYENQEAQKTRTL